MEREDVLTDDLTRDAFSPHPRLAAPAAREAVSGAGDLPEFASALRGVVQLDPGAFEPTGA